MCMENPERTNFPKTKYAWKVMRFKEGKWITPFQIKSPKNNKLCAVGKPDFNIILGSPIDEMSLRGGSIHCFRTKRAALSFYAEHVEEVFKVIGKNPVAFNSRHIAFEEIEFVDTINDWEIE